MHTYILCIHIHIYYMNMIKCRVVGINRASLRESPRRLRVDPLLGEVRASASNRHTHVRSRDPDESHGIRSVDRLCRVQSGQVEKSLAEKRSTRLLTRPSRDCANWLFNIFDRRRLCA